MLKINGTNLPLPNAFDDSQLFAEDPSVIAQPNNNASTRWNIEITPADSSRNTVEKRRAKFHQARRARRAGELVAYNAAQVTEAASVRTRS